MRYPIAHSRRPLLALLLLSLLAYLLPSTPVPAQPSDAAIRLLVRGDDMGVCHSGNAALIKAFREGILRSVEVLVPGPWFPEAVAMLAENPELDVGVHLALTSEWDGMKWRPLTPVPSLVDADGYFFPNVGEPGRPDSGLFGAPDAAEVEQELRAQIELARRHIRNVTHLSTHMFDPETHPAIAAVVARLSREFGLPIEMSFSYIGALGRWPTATAEEKETAFVGHLERIGGGVWFILFHPGLDDPELGALHVEPWYPNVAADRTGDLQVLTSPRVREVIDRRKIRLVSYGDLIRGR